MKNRLALIPLLALFLAAPAAAQVPAQSPPPDRPLRNQQRPLNPGEVQSIVDGYVIVQAETALKLTDEQFPEFVKRLRVLQEGRRRGQRTHNQIIQEIARLTDPAAPQPDEARLREKLKALDDADQKAAADLRKAYDSIDQILDVRQQARFRVFLDQVERRMLDILTRARMQAARGRGR